MTTLTPLTRSQLQAAAQEYVDEQTKRFLTDIVKEIYCSVKQIAQRGESSYFYKHNKSMNTSNRTLISVFSHHEILIEMLKEVFPDSHIEFINGKEIHIPRGIRGVPESGIVIDWS